MFPTNMRAALAALLLTALVPAPAAGAPEEGLLFPWQVTDARLAAPGSRLTREGFVRKNGDLGPLTGAVGRISTGGTGFFVSGRGLVLTNYHVVESFLACADRPGQPPVAEGFLAASPEREIPLPGLEMELVTGMEDVTDRIRGTFRSDLGPAARRGRENEAIARLVREAARGDEEECRVTSLDGRRRFVLTRFVRLTDLRLVWLPPARLARFGGDAANWRMPRWAADAALLRAWAPPPGRPAAPAPAPAPWTPPFHLPLTLHGVRAGDFQVVAGFPGATFRRHSSADAASLVRDILPARIALLEDLVETLSRLAADGLPAAGARRTAAANLLAYAQGLRDGLSHSVLLQPYTSGKTDRSTPPALARALRHQEELLAGLAAGAQRDRLLGLLTWASDLVRAAEAVRRAHAESDRPDERRPPEYRREARAALAGRLGSRCDSLPATAQPAVLAVFFRHLRDLPGDALPATLRKVLAEEEDGAAAARLAGGSRLLDPSYRLALLEGTAYAAARRNDPLLAFWTAVEKEWTALRRQENPRQLELEWWRQDIADALRIAGKGALPDADGTLRVSSGVVRALEDGPDRGLWRTILPAPGAAPGRPPEGYPDDVARRAREEGFAPFGEPGGLFPVNYVCDADLSGGNSGSPVLDGQGRVTGVVFDALYDAIASDWRYDARASRALCVDVRHILFLVRSAGGEGLLAELGALPTKTE